MWHRPALEGSTGATGAAGITHHRSATVKTRRCSPRSLKARLTVRGPRKVRRLGSVCCRDCLRLPPPAPASRPKPPRLKGQAPQPRRGATDRGEHCQTARATKPPPGVGRAVISKRVIIRNGAADAAFSRWPTGCGIRPAVPGARPFLSPPAPGLAPHRLRFRRLIVIFICVFVA